MGEIYKFKFKSGEALKNIEDDLRHCKESLARMLEAKKGGVVEPVLEQLIVLQQSNISNLERASEELSCIYSC